MWVFVWTENVNCFGIHINVILEWTHINVILEWTHINSRERNRRKSKLTSSFPFHIRSGRLLFHLAWLKLDTVSNIAWVGSQALFALRKPSWVYKSWIKLLFSSCYNKYGEGRRKLYIKIVTNRVVKCNKSILNFWQNIISQLMYISNRSVKKAKGFFCLLFYFLKCLTWFVFNSWSSELKLHMVVCTEFNPIHILEY